MINWFKSLPKTTFVTLVLVVGVFYIVASDPPKGICDAQMDQFDVLNKGLLTPNPKNPSHKTSKYQDLFALCKETKSPGGCYELFLNLKAVIRNARTISTSCFSKLAKQDNFNDAIWSSLELMVRMAWGDKPPDQPQQKLAWFDAADLNLVCTLKQTAIDVFGKEQFDSFQEKFLTGGAALPGAEKMSRADVWKRMLFSITCTQYLYRLRGCERFR